LLSRRVILPSRDEGGHAGIADASAGNSSSKKGGQLAGRVRIVVLGGNQDMHDFAHLAEANFPRDGQ
jgi:hypothetical protein